MKVEVDMSRMGGRTKGRKERTGDQAPETSGSAESSERSGMEEQSPVACGLS